MASADLSCAIITPSFRADFEQCRLLTETVSEHVAPHVRHYLTVDKRDRKLFADLRGPRTEVVLVEDVVPSWIRRPPFARRWWLSLKTPPIRNWMLQQIVKLSVAAFVPADVLIFVDSDVFFVRSYDPIQTMRDGKVPLFREYGEELRSEFNQRWHHVGAKLFGLEPLDDYLTSYVGNLITWRTENVHLLHEHIENVTGRSWIESLSRLPAMSEYVLYGMFCEHILKERSGHYFDSAISSLCYWRTQKLDIAGLEELRGGLRPEHVAVMVSAKSRTPVDDIRHVFGKPAGRLASVPATGLAPA
jgi:hypothetical protein